MVLYDRSQPLYLEGYHRPDYRDKDDNVYDAIADLMSNGRTSRLYRALVRDKKIAADSAGFTGLPGNKYPHLFAFYAFPLPGHKPEEMAEAIHSEIERLKNQDISDEELKMIRTRAKANLLRGLDGNEGLASELALFQARYGDWRELSTRWTISTRSAKLISGASPTRSLFPRTAPWGLSKTWPRLRRAAKTEVGNEKESDKASPVSAHLRLG